MKAAVAAILALVAYGLEEGSCQAGAGTGCEERGEASLIQVVRRTQEPVANNGSVVANCTDYACASETSYYQHKTLLYCIERPCPPGTHCSGDAPAGESPCVSGPPTPPTTPTTTTTTTTTPTTTTTNDFLWEELVEQQNQNCLDYNLVSGNAYAHRCHGGANQLWRFNIMTGELIVKQDELCATVMPFNGPNMQVALRTCNGSPEQKWREELEPQSQRGSAFERNTDSSPADCLDYSAVSKDNDNVYQHPCTFKGNQRWVWTAP